MNYIKDNLKMKEKMDMEYYIMKMEIYIKENLKMRNQMDMEY